MHYYERNIGDYYRKAGRLNILQHGVYTLLIDACYDREKFPTLEEAIDWVWAESDEEIEAVKFALRKFFKLNDDGTYVQNHIEEDLTAYKAFLEKQSENGKKGGRPPKQNPSETQNNLNQPTETQTKPKPITNNQEPSNQEPLNHKTNLNLKNKNGWFDFSKFEIDFQCTYPDMDFESIKSAPWFEREKKAFEKFNADKGFDADMMMYHFVDRIAQVYKTKYKPENNISPVSHTRSSTNLSEKQIAMYSAKLAHHTEFASKYAPVGMNTESFVGWVGTRLVKPEYQKDWAVYLKQVGYAGGLMS